MIEKQRSQQDVFRGGQSPLEAFEGDTEKVGKLIQSPECPKGITTSDFVLHGPVCHMTKRKVLSWIKVGNQG